MYIKVTYFHIKCRAAFGIMRRQLHAKINVQRAKKVVKNECELKRKLSRGIWKCFENHKNKAQIWYAASTESKIQSSKADNEDFLQSWSVCSCARLATISWLLEAARGWRVLAFEWLLSYKYYNNSTTVINTTQQLIDNSAHLSAANEWQFKAAAAPQQRANSSKQVPSAI